MSLTLQIRYKPHDGQKQFHDSNARFRILACGRRWGKTLSGANEAIKRALLCGNDSVGFCVAPTYWHTQKQWAEFLLYCPKDLVKEIHRGEHSITMLGNRKVWFKSADNPDSLRSEGLDWLWMDEGGQIKEEAWTLALRPALMDKKGCAWFTGTPKGHNWYFMLWTKGQDPKQTEYQSWQYSSKENPYIDPKEIEDFARDMPELAYRQEILAEFMEDIGAVFRGVDTCIEGTLNQPAPNIPYFMGVDFAKTTDYSVICIVDNQGHLTHFDRFDDVDWVLQRKRVVATAQRYNHANVLVDSSGVGDPIYDELRRENVHVQGYKFTNVSKANLIENLSIQIENHNITYPEIPALINELKLFGYETSQSGLIKYHAPSGYHDDCVIALALAVWQISRPRFHFGSLGAK